MGSDSIEYLIWKKLFRGNKEYRRNPSNGYYGWSKAMALEPASCYPFFSVSQMNIISTYLEYGETYSWLMMQYGDIKLGELWNLNLVS